ncbi:MAG: YbaK/EbsC family protein [Thermoanaerobaculia bacterium]
MHRNAEKVQEVLASLACNETVVELAETTRSASEAASAIGTTVAQIAKSLVFLAGESAVLVIASGVNYVSLLKLSNYLGKTVVRADADTVKRVTGFPIGGTAPVGHKTALRILIDRDLINFPEIWAAAGTPHAVFRIAPAELIRITGGELVDISGER